MKKWLRSVWSILLLPSAFRLLHFLRKRSALDQLHGVERAVRRFADFVDGDDVRMIELRRKFSLGEKSFARGLAGKLTGENHLHRDLAPQARLPRAIDHAHRAAAKFLAQFVATEAQP